MAWEFWSKQLDEEELVENGEFGTVRVLDSVCGFYYKVCTLLYCSHAVIKEKWVLNKSLVGVLTQVMLE